MKSRVAAAGILPALLSFLAVLIVLGSVLNIFAAPAPEPPKEAPPAQAAPPAAPKPSPAVPPDKAVELGEREKAVRAEEERLLALRKEVDAKITKYEKLLGELETKGKRKRKRTRRRSTGS